LSPISGAAPRFLHGALKIDAPNGMTLALVVFQRDEIALAISLLVLIGRGPMLD
jgi:hypothetical protein